MTEQGRLLQSDGSSQLLSAASSEQRVPCKEGPVDRIPTRTRGQAPGQCRSLSGGGGWSDGLCPAALEQQCDEHRRRAKELKHKSQHLSNVLMTLTPVSLPPPVKRPRLARATSGPAAIASQVLAQSAQIALTPGVPVSQLTSVPLGKVVSTLPSPVLGKAAPQVAPASSPASPLLGGYTVLASSGTTFPNTVEIHPDASSLTVLSTAAMQDGSTVVKVVSPLQLLTLPGLGPTLQNVAQVSPGGSTIVTVPTGTVESAVAAPGPEEHTATIEVAAMAEGHEHK